MSRKMIVLISLTMCLSLFAGISRAADEDLFVTVTNPDVLIILDLSGSMAYSPSGSSSEYWANSTCDGGWMSASDWQNNRNYSVNDYRVNADQVYRCILAHESSAARKPGEGASWTTYWVNAGKTICRRIDIAKRSLFKLLNDDNTTNDATNNITSADVTSLGMRIGFMRYYNCDSTSGTKEYDDSTGCIKLSWGITATDNTTTTPYSSIYCNNTTCASTVNSCTVTNPVKECIAGYGTTGGTPLAIALREGKHYLDDHKAQDASRTCRQKSVIVITDGADTYSCSGNGSSTGISQRRSPVKYAKDLADANYKVYVVGFGTTMADTDIRTLNWMAYHGGTRNPNQTQSAVPSGFSVATDPCSAGSDPGDYNLSGYAFMASNPAELASALKSAISSIQEANYSFSSQASVAAARVQEENFLYEASFEPKNNSGANKEPFWVGHLKKFGLTDAGVLITPACWDAGAKMRDQADTARNMWTYKNNALTSFDTTNIKDADLGVGTSTTACGTSCTGVVGFYRGEATYNLENWKLGDIFHSNPVAIRTPTAYFYDPRQCGATAFNSFRTNNERTAANGKQLILVGANDGQLHAIIAGGSSTDCTVGGGEAWSFIPPNLLQKMPPVAHNSHTDRSTLASHAYFVDGPLEISDVWLPSAASSGITKAASEWKTIAVFGEGQGSSDGYLWSSSSSCHSASTSGFSANYSTTYPYYCGYWALGFTETTAPTPPQPVYKWHLGGSNVIPAAQAPYLGEAWSKMQIGRVNIAGNERWVGFIGGGFNNANCESSTNCNATGESTAGKGFFVVDLSDGTILWSFTHGATATSTTNPAMDFSAPATPLPLDLDNDGFIDTVYMGDMGGNMWRFRLCPRDAVCYKCGLDTYYNEAPTGYTDPCGTCDTSSWSGSLLYQTTAVERGSGLTPASTSHKQIFTVPTATKDASGYVWVYFGTGENNDPTVKPTDTSNTKNRLYGIKDTTYNRYGATSSCTTDTTNCTGRGCIDGFCFGSPVTNCSTYCPGAARTTTNLTDITSTSTTYENTSSTYGWYINLSTNTLTRSDGTTIVSPMGEKMISDPTVFGGVVFFTTHVPDQEVGSACGESGDAFLYGIKYIPEGGGGGGAFESGGSVSRTKYVGHGIGSAPVMSMRPGGGGGAGTTDIYATASGGAGTSALTQKLGNAPTTASMTNILYWKDRRMQ